MSSAASAMLEKNNLNPKQLSLVIPHQANARIIDSIAKKLALNDDQIISTIDQHANTSAASIPLALGEALKTNALTDDSIVLLVAFGGGFTWGAALIHWMPLARN